MVLTEKLPNSSDFSWPGRAGERRRFAAENLPLTGATRQDF